MDAARAVVADILSRDIVLEAKEGKIRWRPAFLLDGPLLERLRAHKPGVIAVLESGERLPACPACRRTLDAKARCAGCFDRRCGDCGRLTGSYCIELCVPCGQRDGED